MTRILSIGEVMLEMSDVGNGLFRKSFAGDTFNMAHYLSVVLHGDLKADYLTAVGCDADSDACLAFLQDHGVSTARCLRDPDRTLGLFILSNDAAGEKRYGYWRGQSAARHVFDAVQDLTGYDLIYISGITAAVTENKDNLVKSVALVGGETGTIAYDFNYRAQLWSPGQASDFAARILPTVNIAKISDEELEILYPGQDVEALSAQYPEAEWVLTCAGDKAEVWKGAALIARHSFEPIAEIIDSSAAGDAFIATYIFAKLAGREVLACLQDAHRIAAQVVCGKGSIVPLDLTEMDSIHA